MKRIAIVTSLSGIGGTEKSLINFLKALPERKYAVDLLLMGEAGPLSEEVPRWISTRYIKETSMRGYLSSAASSLKLNRLVYGVYNYLMIRRQIAKYKADTMYQYKKTMFLFEKIDTEYDIAASWYVPNSFETVFTIENVKAKRKVLWVHMDVRMDPMPVDAESVFKLYDKIYCVSKACKNSFDGKYPTCKEKTEVYYNLIDAKAVKAAAEILPAEMNDSLNSFRIVTCGRLTYEKQPLLSIEIVKKLISNGCDDFIWYFVGDGNLAEEFQRQIDINGLDRYIRILGAKLNPYSYVGHADLFVQMSLHESYCLTLAEAQILGVPSITTDFPSAYEIVCDKVTGHIVSSDPEAIYKRIEYFIKYPDEMKLIRYNLSDHSIKSNGSISQFINYADL